MNNAVIATPLYTGDLTPTIENYVQRFRFYARRTAENIILLAETAYEAELLLKPGEFEAFCEEVNMDHKSSTYRKMRQIGKLRDRFLPHLDKIPNNWTTIYELSKLTDKQFEGLVENKIINTEVTADKIKAVVNANDNQKIETVADYVTFSVTMKAKSIEDAFQMEQDLQKVASLYNTGVKIGNDKVFEQWKLVHNNVRQAA